MDAAVERGVVLKALTTPSPDLSYFPRSDYQEGLLTTSSQEGFFPPPLQILNAEQALNKRLPETLASHRCFVNPVP
jgi:hypothetical protein